MYIIIYILYITELRPPSMQRMLQDRASRRPENGLGTQLQWSSRCWWNCVDNEFCNQGIIQGMSDEFCNQFLGTQFKAFTSRLQNCKKGTCHVQLHSLNLAFDAGQRCLAETCGDSVITSPFTSTHTDRSSNGWFRCKGSKSRGRRD